MAILQKKKKEKVHKPVLPNLLDIISPTAYGFEARKIIAGDLFQRVLVVTAFPSNPGEAWIAKSVNLPGVTATIHIEPTDPYDLIKDIQVSLGELEGKLIQGGNPYSLKQTESKLEDTENLLKLIDREQQQVVNMTIVFLVTATSPEMLDTRTKKLETTLASGGLRGRAPIYKQEEGLRSVGPWQLLEDDIREIGARNMPILSAAASFPFVYSGLNDGKGVLLGTDETGGIVLLDLWLRAESRTNSNMFISGKPGMGKSATVKKILRAEYGQGTKIIIIDPEREYKDLCEKVDGDWIDCGGGAGGRINPLQVRIVPLDDDGEEEGEKLYSDEAAQRGPLALHFQTLRTFYSLYLKSLTDMQMAYLEIILEKTYADKNIFWDTDPESVPNEGWPVQKDVYEMAERMYDEEQDKEYKEIAMLLRSSAIGADAFLWSGHTTIKANSNFIVLDIKNLLEADRRILRAQFFNVLGWAWNEVSRNREEKVLLGTDETYLLVDPENVQPLQFLRNTNKRIRKYEGGLLTITHNLVDFLDPSVIRYGQALVDNPTYKILMGQGEKDIEALTRLMSLSDKECEILSDSNRGKALLVAGNRRLDVNIHLTPQELAMFGKAGGR